ncbi:hypothetical protein [Bradyrhizobium sp. USDA 4350]
MKLKSRTLARWTNKVLSYWWPPVQLRWTQEGNVWRLQPSMLTVRETSPGFWNVFLGEAPSVQLNYSSACGAKAGAVTQARGLAFAMFGTHNIEVEDA